MSKGVQQPRAVARPTDPDVDLAVPAQRREVAHGLGPVVAVVALGGVVGACARYGASLLWVTHPGSFPWTTLLVNGVGCAVIGVFMVVITEVWAAHRLVRPFFGTGVLGGFTTFSTYAVDIQKLLAAGQPRAGLAYLALTLVTALTMVWSAVWVTRRALVRRRR
ncbi:fluoride efflux transporter CrcB [Streptomyces sp. NPDC001691]|uniref:fluoride efflux transporter CrcB n=1 Tax=unclassified Streptomyces TaxID=2593676 RepID=UPI000DEB4CDF|nr:fluoride efflux transporter CrcB [Streptomyces sp. SDr-06]RCH70057.1 fluoride efflux transporter CrcB [Streptomyces sp. SDr-06]